MRTGNDAQRSVIKPTLVKMQSYCEHVIHDFRWRLDVHDPIFHCPRSKALNITALSNGNRQILMPNNLPICASRFVEKYRPHGKAFRSHNRFHYSTDWSGYCQLTNTWNRKEISLRIS